MSNLALTPLPEEARADFTWVRHPPLMAILTALHGAGGEPMFVGGCVRDSLIGMPPDFNDPETRTDIDIATVLRPEDTIRALEAAGIKAIPTGADHGTITAVSQGQVAEITTLRADIDTDGRHAEVAFTTNWDEDWRRRDFTINAMYLSADLQLYDPAGGREALANQQVRFIGDAPMRIREDYLRILRFYRFSARYAHELDPTGALACRELHSGLRQISKERIGQEMLKILAGPRRAFVLAAMAEHSVLEEVFPDPTDLDTVRQLSNHGETVPAEIMLAALWPDAEKGAVASALRLSNAEATRRTRALQAARDIDFAPGETRCRALLYRWGETAFRDGLLLARAWAAEEENLDMSEEAGRWEAALLMADNWPIPAFPLTAADFKAKGVEPGPALGQVLKAAEEQWIVRDFPMDDVSLSDIAEAAMKDINQSDDG